MPAPRRYSAPRRFRLLARAPSHHPAGSSVGASLPTFHVKAADRARAAYMPGTAWPVTGFPPDSSWDLVPAPVLMPPETNFDTSTAIRLRSPSRSPPDASCAPFPTRSRQRSSANAAVGGLTPLPEERRRRVSNPSSPTQQHNRSRSPTYKQPPSPVRVAHTRSSFSRGAAPGPGGLSRVAMAARSLRAWSSVSQCAIMSSA
jgi:hypothetical protein